VEFASSFFQRANRCFNAAIVSRAGRGREQSNFAVRGSSFLHNPLIQRRLLVFEFSEKIETATFHQLTEQFAHSGLATFVSNFISFHGPPVA
jgi:hypothetical protein